MDIKQQIHELEKLVEKIAATNEAYNDALYASAADPTPENIEAAKRAAHEFRELLQIAPAYRERLHQDVLQ